MTDPALIFQRTQAGRDEIYRKTHGLTQSERLVLIMVDGVSSYQAVRNKLPVLTDDRFNRALKNLQKKELILEVLLPLADQAADELESTIIDRFLQQDPLDPITIMLADPEEYFGTPDVIAPQQAVSEAQNFAKDDNAFDELDKLAEIVESEVRARQLKPNRQPVRIDSSMQEFPEFALRESDLPQAGPIHLHWGYWMIALGLAFIFGYIAARLAR